jgi:hypothetical protein
MKREWKPGDLALVKVAHLDDPRPMFRTESGWDDGGESYWAGATGDWAIEYARPLVIIDPEDAEQVDRLRSLYVDEAVKRGAMRPQFAGADELRRESFAAALREFANPTPPKPEEPTGLGAVVEDTNGVPWVRVSDGTHRWRSSFTGGEYRWSDFEPVRVLSEGVQS